MSSNISIIGFLTEFSGAVVALPVSPALPGALPSILVSSSSSGMTNASSRSDLMSEVSPRLGMLTLSWESNSSSPAYTTSSTIVSRNSFWLWYTAPVSPSPTPSLSKMVY